MGVLTDFVVGERQDAQRVCDSACPSEEYAGLDAKGIDTVNMGTLRAIVTGKPFDPTVTGCKIICSAGAEGPWVFEVPSDLVERLASLDAAQIGAAASEWAKTEEFSPQYGDWSPESVHQVLGALASLCGRAVSERKGVLMWMCL